jgi:hypothetical protein
MGSLHENQCCPDAMYDNPFEIAEGDAVPSTPRKIEPVRPPQSDYGSSVNEMHTQGLARARQSPLYKAVMEIPDLFTVGPMFQRAASPDCD